MRLNRERVIGKWIRLGLTVALILVLLVIAAGVGFEKWSQSSALRNFPPHGKLIEYDGRLSHLSCIGEGSPTVLLEGGLGVGGSQEWQVVQLGIAAETRVCSYDRAGILWSEPRRGPRDALQIVEELHGILGAASEFPPYIVVGHSLGGLLVRVYTDRYPDKVAGVVLVDASHPAQFERYPPEVVEYLAQVESSLPSRLVARLWAISGGYRLTLGPSQTALHAFLPRTVPWGFLGERAARDAISEQAAEAGTLGSRPLLVLTAGMGPRYPGVADHIMDDFYQSWLDMQAELAALSCNSLHRVINGAGHNIHSENPEAVVNAVKQVVTAVRQRTPLIDSTEVTTDDLGTEC